MCKRLGRGPLHRERAGTALKAIYSARLAAGISRGKSEFSKIPRTCTYIVFCPKHAVFYPPATSGRRAVEEKPCFGPKTTRLGKSGISGICPRSFPWEPAQSRKPEERHRHKITIKNVDVLETADQRAGSPESKWLRLNSGRVLCKRTDLYVMHVCEKAMYRSRFAGYHRFVRLFEVSESVFYVRWIRVIEVIHAELRRHTNQTSHTDAYESFDL